MLPIAVKDWTSNAAMIVVLGVHLQSCDISLCTGARASHYMDLVHMQLELIHFHKKHSHCFL